MTNGARPSRAILNFAHRCAMKCEWCYVPFGTSSAQEPVLAKVVERIAELGFTRLTFGGGDPFQYRFIVSTLELAKTRGLFVHVDTHGLGLRETDETLALLRSTVDLLGLPLDGSSAAVHDEMRQSPGHYARCLRKVAWLGDFHSRLKLNTIVSKFNLTDLPALGSVVSSLRPSRWSIYQYWPVGPAAKVEGKHALAETAFLEAAERVRTAFLVADITLEVNSAESRRNTYPIIHHDGEVFVHAAPPENSFLHLGSIFDDHTMERINATCVEDRPAALERYGRGSMRGQILKYDFFKKMIFQILTISWCFC